MTTPTTKPTGKDVCETSVRVRRPDGSLTDMLCASDILAMVQAWQDVHGAPVPCQVESTFEGPVLWFGIVGGPIPLLTGGA